MRVRFAVQLALLLFTAVTLAACVEHDSDISDSELLASPIVGEQQPVVSAVPPAYGANQRGQSATELLSTPVQTPEALRGGAFAQERYLFLPPGFAIAVIARVPGARSLAHTPRGEVLVTRPRQGELVALRPGGEGEVAGQRLLAGGLQCPYGMVMREGHLYVAQSTRIDRFALGEDGTLGEAETVVSGLPESPCGPHHYRPLVIDGDGFLYTAFGSSCNVCVEADPRRGTIWRYAPNGAGSEYARGLRNVVDLEFHPESGQLWVATNERDNLGDDIPPEPVGPIEAGADYGWPFCYWDGGRWVVDGRVPSGNPDCTGLSVYNGLPAHSAPLGLALLPVAGFPPEFSGGAFVALHGSWNRSSGVGFSITFVPTAEGKALPAREFVTGWLTGPRGPADAWGRPVDVLAGADGALYISDDAAGAVYRVTYTGN